MNLTGTTANISLTFYAENTSTATLVYTDTIAAGGSKNYYTPSSFTGLGSSFLGSAVVSSDQQISCNVNTQTTGTGTSTDPYRIGTSAGFSQGALTMYAPQVMKNLGGTTGVNWSSYIAVQNTGSSATTVTVTYRDSNGNAITAATESQSVPAGSNKVFYQASNANLASGFIGAATISASSGGTIAASVAFYNDGSSSGAAQFHSYNAFSTGAAKLFVPRVTRRFYGYNSGLSIQNVGATAVSSITVTFTFNGVAYNVVRSTALNPGAAWAIYLPNLTELNPVDALNMTLRFGSAVITAPAGSSIVAIVNEDNRGVAADNDGGAVPAERIGQGSTYNAAADGTQTATVFFAQIARNAGAVFSGGFQVANTTATATTCSITYGTSGVTESGISLAGNGSFARYAPNVASLPDGYNSSATVTCGQPVVGIANLAVNTGSGKFGDSFTQGNGLNQ